jgi:hypothetical protein
MVRRTVRFLPIRGLPSCISTIYYVGPASRIPMMVLHFRQATSIRHRTSLLHRPIIPNNRPPVLRNIPTPPLRRMRLLATIRICHRHNSRSRNIHNLRIHNLA